ncbi:MAG: DUF3048 domain-containing protein [Actinomycetota bacterium]|nr:DUF3048 domain-containing protein [Actinomycetota bacterium]
MALTRRGRRVVAIGGAASLLIAVIVWVAMSGGDNPLTNTLKTLTGNTTPPPPPCPLTGLQPLGGKTVPQRPVLAVKVDNTASAYPLAGLDKADVLYEELVEGGITRFMGVFQCQDSGRVGPVRSARTTDPRVLLQYGKEPLIAYSGGQLAVVNLLDRSGLFGLTEDSAPGGFTRDTTRIAPYNLFVNTPALYGLAKKTVKRDGVSDPVFTYSTDAPKGRAVRAVAIDFSSSSIAQWSWLGGRWVRMLDGAPMKLEDGKALTVDNILIQQVVVTESNLVDVLGNHSPDVTLTGKGKAWLLRNGKLIEGSWSRKKLSDVTVFRTKQGQAFVLTPGTTFVELAPKSQAVTFGH